MNDEEITALANGMVPFVRECLDAATAPLLERMAALEARPLEKGETGPQGECGPQGPPGPKGESGEMALLPPELAEQVASAVRQLHELPPIEQRAAPPPPPAPRVARIERDEDGNLVPIYEPQ